MSYFLSFISAFILSIFFTKIVKKLSFKFKILDYPNSDPKRKIHKVPMPLLGGVALFFSFFLTLGFVFFFKFWSSGLINFNNIAGVFLASFVLIVGGVWDDKKNLNPFFQFFFSFLAVLIIIFSGIGIEHINHPFTERLVFLESSKIELFVINNFSYHFSWPADLISFVWLLLVIYAIKLLAGLDGLVPGITLIGALIVAFFCLFTAFHQPQVAVLSLILAGVSIGFLFFNFHPAKIFLGNSGEMFLGLMIGVLAIISGSKIAIFLLILGVPILDLVWVFLRRIIKEKKSPFQADKKHLHFRLLNFGFSHRGAVVFLWGLSLVFGLIGLLFPQTKIKILALGILILMMIVLATVVTKKRKCVS